MADSIIQPLLSAFDSLPDSALVDVKVMAGLFGCSENTAWRRYGGYSIKVSPQQTRWLVGDVRKIMARLLAKRQVVS
ncbi:transcriptional regulator [Azonexus hydrophilus]|uniref:transcriptional regulator n=1 Tax=Azonexus hydrophilus TaxID=418702 RepID=UPI001965081D|nr:transcriptional regulator [Azonexus hydrophilus]